MPVTGGPPQGSVPGPVLFIFYLNGVDVGNNNRIKKSTDNAKISNSVLTDEDREIPKVDLHKISAWYDTWKMPFNIDKCHVLQAGKRNQKFDHDTCDAKLKSLQCVTDLGVKIASNLSLIVMRRGSK